MTHFRRHRAAVCLCLLTTFLSISQFGPVERLYAVAGALTIDTLGVPVDEQFDGLTSTGTGTWMNDSTILGWYHARTGTGTTIVANNGGSNAGNLYSYGATSATDRALGSVGSGNAAAGNFYWGVRIANGTASTITSLTVSYTGEQWRNGGAAAQTVDASYRVGVGLGSTLTDFTTGGVVVPELSFTSPVTGGTAGALDGNANAVAISHTITGLNLAPGQELLLRWTDIDHSGSDHGLAIDNLSITANGGGAPALSINDVSVTEGDGGTVAATFTVSTSTSAHGGVTFDIATEDGSGPNAAMVVDGDYLQRTEINQSIQAGDTTYRFTVTVNGDTALEGDETFTVNLTNVSGATLLDGTGIGLIVNDEAPPPTSSEVTISQVYGGGGNSGATLTHDFVELFNGGTTTATLAGWSVQYVSASGSGTWQPTALSGSIAPGGYYLVQLAQGSGGTIALPTPDAVGSIAMSATAGKVALRTTTTPFAGACPVGNVVDFVGYGAASCFEGAGPTGATANATGALRKRGGCFDSDNNNIDFVIGSPAPRNSSSPNQSCTPTPATISEIQSSGPSTPYLGQYVSTTGIVTGLKSNGFFLQTPDADVDANPLTSEALFVFTSAAPAVTPGQALAVAGTAGEFFNLTQIEATLPGDITVVSSGQAVPDAVTLTTTILDASGTADQLERFEAMRMYADALRSVAPTNNFGEIAAVLPTVARPMREPGISVLDPVPPDPSSGVADCCIPRFDENPERIVIDSDGLAGAAALPVTSNVLIGPITGPLDFTFGEYKVLPETLPGTSGNMAGLAVPEPTADEFTVGSFNIENFAGNETRRQKAALAIRQLMRSPDVIGHVEILDLATLQTLATQVNDDAVAAGEANPAYEAVLIPAPGGGTQNVGFLVKTSRVHIDAVTQERAGDTFINPNNGQSETLHDRPPLVLRATVDPDGPNPRPVIVVVNHLRSFIDIELVGGEGPRVRAKRTAQAESVASLLQDLQATNPGTAVMTIGDFNAYEFNDGYTDPIAILTGSPTPDDEIVVDESPDLVDPNFTNLTDSLPLTERYSFIFQGTPQALDHVIVNNVALSFLQRYAIARGNADFPELPAALFADDVTRPEGSSDHDMPVAYFRFPPPSADLAVTVASDTTVAAGGQITYTVTLTNNGPSPAQDVSIATTLGSSASVVSCTAADGGVCGAGGAVSYASLASGETRTITLVVAIACAVPDGAAVAATVSVSSATGDPNSGNNSASASTSATNSPPSISGAAASRTRLLLPLHQMVPVAINYTATDSCGAVTTTLAVTSNEPVTAHPRVQGLAGLTSPDWQVVNPHLVRLRAERSIHGDGRVYTITITATDVAGGTSTAVVTVTVPRFILPWMQEHD